MYDMHTCIIHTYTLTYTSVDTYTLTYTSVDICVCRCVCKCVRMYNTYTRVRMYNTYTLTYTLTYTSVDTYLSYTPVFNTCLHIHLRTNWSPLRVDTYIHMHTSLNQYPYTYM